LAAGRGERLGADVPKALVRIGDCSVLARSAAALGAATCVSAVLPVVTPGAEASFEELRRCWKGPATLLDPVFGGATRQASVARGLAELERRIHALEWVLVHDAARCLVEPEDAMTVLQAAQGTGAAIPVVPVTDTLKEIDRQHVVSTPDRTRYGRAQTPQAFRVELLRRALELAERDGFQGTDCASLVERLGVAVRVCRGREENIKLTTAEDLARIQSLLARAQLEPPTPRARAAGDVT